GSTPEGPNVSVHFALHEIGSSGHSDVGHTSNVHLPGPTLCKKPCWNVGLPSQSSATSKVISGSCRIGHSGSASLELPSPGSTPVSLVIASVVVGSVSSPLSVRPGSVGSGLVWLPGPGPDVDTEVVTASVSPSPFVPSNAGFGIVHPATNPVTASQRTCIPRGYPTPATRASGSAPST